MSQGLGVDPVSRVGLPRLSRYRATYLHPDLSMTFGLWPFRNLTIPPDISDGTHKVELAQRFRWDLIAFLKYGDEAYYWALILVNGVMDPFVTPSPGDMLRVPTRDRIDRLLLTTTESRLQTLTAQSSTVLNPI